MALTEKEEGIQQEALEFARANKKDIAKRLTNPDVFLPEENPVSVFMAGSPGAGKTEASIALINEIDGPPIIRIDPDDLRREFKTYDGNNAWLFQRGVSILVDKIHDLALQQGQSFLLDGTMSNYEKSLDNVNRSLKERAFSADIVCIPGAITGLEVCAGEGISRRTADFK